MTVSVERNNVTNYIIIVRPNCHTVKLPLIQP